MEKKGSVENCHEGLSKLLLCSMNLKLCDPIKMITNINLDNLTPSVLLNKL